MSIEGIDRKQLEELAAASASVMVPASLLRDLIETIEKLEAEIAELKLNSRTSSTSSFRSLDHAQAFTRYDRSSPRQKNQTIHVLQTPKSTLTSPDEAQEMLLSS